MKNYKRMIGSEDKYLKSCSQQVQHQPPSHEQITGHGNSMDKLEISEIDDLIQLIDSCVEEANDYIGYLTEKIEVLKT